MVDGKLPPPFRGLRLLYPGTRASRPCSMDIEKIQEPGTRTEVQGTRIKGQGKVLRQERDSRGEVAGYRKNSLNLDMDRKSSYNGYLEVNRCIEWEKRSWSSKTNSTII